MAAASLARRNRSKQEERAGRAGAAGPAGSAGMRLDESKQEGEKTSAKTQTEGNAQDDGHEKEEDFHGGDGSFLGSGDGPPSSPLTPERPQSVGAGHNLR